MEEKTIWYAKDPDGWGIISNCEITRDKDENIWTCNNCIGYMNPYHADYFPDIDWKDEPIQIKITKVE